LKFTRNRYQQGSLRKVPRNSGADVWEYRYRNNAEPGSPMRQITLSTLEFPTENKALIHLQERVLRINGPQAYCSQNAPTLGLVIERFSKEGRLEDILKQKPGQTTITDGLS
jgi:integrase